MSQDEILSIGIDRIAGHDVMIGRFDGDYFKLNTEADWIGPYYSARELQRAAATFVMEGTVLPPVATEKCCWVCDQPLSNHGPCPYDEVRSRLAAGRRR